MANKYNTIQYNQLLLSAKTKAWNNSLEEIPSKTIRIWKINQQIWREIWNTVTVNLTYGHCVVYSYKMHIHFAANKMYEYLQFSTKSIAKAILSSSF